MDNPYQTPGQMQGGFELPNRWVSIFKFVPLAIIAGVVGGILNRSPIQFSFLVPLHPLASSGASFGAACAIVALFVSERRIARVFALPMVLIVAFHLSGALLDDAARRFQEGSGWGEFVLRIIGGTLAGTSLIAGWLWFCRVLRRRDVVRFAVFSAITAALCVVVVNATPVKVSYRSLLFWSMCGWQFFMILYLAWITSVGMQKNESVTT